MDREEINKAFEILEYIKDNELPGAGRGASLNKAYHEFKMGREEFLIFTKYLQERGYIKRDIDGGDTFSRENTETTQIEPHPETKARLTEKGGYELKDRERRQIEKVLNDSILKTNETQRRSLRFSGVVSLFALAVSLGTYFNRAPKEVKQQNIILQSQVRVLQSLLQIQKQNQATFLMIAKGDSLGKKK